MPSACPQCGTDLNITLCSVDATDTTILAPATPAAHQQQHALEATPDAGRPSTPPPPYRPDLLSLSLPPTLDSDLHQPPDPTLHNAPQVTNDLAPLPRVKRLLCPCPCSHSDLVSTHARYRVATLRPYLCFDGVGQLAPGRPHAALHRAAAKMQAAISRCEAGSADALLAARRSAEAMEAGRAEKEAAVVFEAVGAVVYDMEWTAREQAVEHAELLADAAHIICRTSGRC
ncbi:hypothetical protein C8A05DRAFT_37256 [Staphylotrichum tortipilum]|uniref:Uncharacterized protein n=1 Tax=Staphylotrichum tortipilum TaxID=2831512 RepID=A0AAN6RQV7_9PEZI|nr:hypothetical protein C8A05DRAFT_37256 [Staphylotrichum longicolle]